MKVLLKRDFVTHGRRYRRNRNGNVIPDGTVLPRDAEVLEGTPGEAPPPRRKPELRTATEVGLDLNEPLPQGEPDTARKKPEPEPTSKAEARAEAKRKGLDL